MSFYAPNNPPREASPSSLCAADLQPALQAFHDPALHLLLWLRSTVPPASVPWASRGSPRALAVRPRDPAPADPTFAGPTSEGRAAVGAAPPCCSGSTPLALEPLDHGRLMRLLRPRGREGDVATCKGEGRPPGLGGRPWTSVPSPAPGGNSPAPPTVTSPSCGLITAAGRGSPGALGPPGAAELDPVGRGA